MSGHIYSQCKQKICSDTITADGKLPNKPVCLIGISGREADQPAQTDLFDQAEQQEDNKRLLKTIDAVTGKFGKHLLQAGVSHKPDK